LTLRTPDGPLALLRPTPDDALDNSTGAGGWGADGMGCFPLLPFSNRIADGRFQRGGTAVALPLNRAGCPHALHGHGWDVAWTTEWRAGDAVRLVYHHRADAWPWSYRAEQTIAVQDDGLLVTLELINTADTAMPAGLGLHPFFPKPPGTTVTAQVKGVWLNDDTMLPRQRNPLPRTWTFADGVAMDHLVLDNGFTGWDGRAVIVWPTAGRRLVLTADGPFGHLVVYSPRDADFLCVEPVTHMTDAVNRPQEVDNGLVMLAPGERLTGCLNLRVEAMASPDQRQWPPNGNV
jgi:aldose 1-epimerase